MPFQIAPFLGVLSIQLQDPLWLFLQQDVLHTVLAGKNDGLFTEHLELLTEFSAEIGVAAKVRVIVEPIAVILNYTVPGRKEQISDSVSETPSEDLIS